MAGEVVVVSRADRKKLFAGVGEIVLKRTIDELRSRS
jgi:hypothetical protein